MNISQSGAISRYRFYEGVFRSHARLTYNKVAAILDGDDAEADTLREQYSALVPSLNNLHTLYMLLREARVERGAIDFETTETAILFNDERKIEAIVPRSRNDAHKIIEECMLAANVATARFLDKHDLPALYRIHEKPSPERLDKLRLFLNELGLSLGGGDDPSPQDYRDLAEAIKGRPDADVIQTVMLRSMSRAVYSPQNDGHFGLAYPAYAHFTSPIRRYPDLLVHRAIRSVIRGPRQTNTVLRAEGAPVEPPSKWAPYTFEQMLELGEHCSMTERRADDATRDVTDWLKCEFMSDKIGEVFDGTIASVTQFGIFVRLDAVYVEGLVHVTSLPSDYYHYEAEKHRLKGERSGMAYRLGDGVTVQVARVDLDERKIDFELVDDKPRRQRPPRKPGADSAAGQSDKPARKKSRRRKPRPGKQERGGGSGGNDGKPSGERS